MRKKPSFQKFDIKLQFDRNNYSNKLALYYSLVALGLSLLSIVLVLVFYYKLPPEVPLFYGLPHGKRQLASRTLLVTPGVAAMLIVAINFFINILTEDKFLKQTLIGVGLLSAVFSIIAVLKVILLVASI